MSLPPLQLRGAGDRTLTSPPAPIALRSPPAVEFMPAPLAGAGSVVRGTGAPPIAVSAASVSSFTASGAAPRPGSSALSRAVARNRQRVEMLGETAAAAAHLSSENSEMEEIVAGEHHMVTDADLREILTAAFLSHGSAILRERKPTRREAAAAAAASEASRRYSTILSPDRRCSMTEAPTPMPTRQRQSQRRQRPCLLPPPDDESPIEAAQRGNHGRVNTGVVNYAVMLDQQRQLHDAGRDGRAQYRAAIANFVRKQQQLHERFAAAGIL